MNASDYLRVRFQNDRQLSIYIDNGFTNTIQAAKGIASDIYPGIERASWYSSCLIPRYNDVCQELKSEEIRTVYSIMSIFRYHDVITYMLYLYFLTVSKDVREGNKEGSAQKMVRNAANLAARITVASGTRFAVASAMAARALKAIDPSYYWILYQAKLEMLYYFVEPALSEIIQKVHAGIYSNLDQLADEIMERFDV